MDYYDYVEGEIDLTQAPPALPEGLRENVHIALDKSGSMRSMSSVHYEGACEFLRQQPDDIYVTFSTFSNRVAVGERMRDTNAVMQAIYGCTCEGATCLYDAIIECVEAEEASPLERTTLVVVTDGADTCSTRSRDDAKAAIRRFQMHKHWRVLFIGTNQDAALSAHQLGIPTERALSFSGVEGVREAYRSVSANVSSYRAHGSDHFTDLQRRASIVDDAIGIAQI